MLRHPRSHGQELLLAVLFTSRRARAWVPLHQPRQAPPHRPGPAPARRSGRPRPSPSSPASCIVCSYVKALSRCHFARRSYDPTRRRLLRAATAVLRHVPSSPSAASRQRPRLAGRDHATEPLYAVGVPSAVAYSISAPSTPRPCVDDLDAPAPATRVTFAPPPAAHGRRPCFLSITSRGRHTTNTRSSPCSASTLPAPRPRREPEPRTPSPPCSDAQQQHQEPKCWPLYSFSSPRVGRPASQPSPLRLVAHARAPAMGHQQGEAAQLKPAPFHPFSDFQKFLATFGNPPKIHLSS